MSGGIYIDKPFQFNLKCVLFAFAIIALYVTSTRSGASREKANQSSTNYYMLPFIFILSYVALSWYDHMYDCSDKLYSGLYGPSAPFDSPFKPQVPKILESIENQEEHYRRNLYLMHAFAIAPIFLFVSWKLWSIESEKGLSGNPGIPALAFSIALFGFGYHSFRFFYPRPVECD
jgi:hypothetical protein